MCFKLFVCKFCAIRGKLEPIQLGGHPVEGRQEDSTSFQFESKGEDDDDDCDSRNDDDDSGDDDDKENN